MRGRSCSTPKLSILYTGFVNQRMRMCFSSMWSLLRLETFSGFTTTVDFFVLDGEKWNDTDGDIAFVASANADAKVTVNVHRFGDLADVVARTGAKVTRGGRAAGGRLFSLRMEPEASAIDELIMENAGLKAV
jgi:hypothetical protein